VLDYVQAAIETGKKKTAKPADKAEKPVKNSAVKAKKAGQEEAS
jgi:hypothetical protein